PITPKMMASPIEIRISTLTSVAPLRNCVSKDPSSNTCVHHAVGRRRRRPVAASGLLEAVHLWWRDAKVLDDPKLALLVVRLGDDRVQRRMTIVGHPDVAMRRLVSDSWARLRQLSPVAASVLRPRAARAVPLVLQ